MVKRPLEQLIGSFYVITIICILLIKYIKTLNCLLKYGKNYENPQSKSIIINYLTSITVPKRWFLHFYIVYFGCCVSTGCFLELLQRDSRLNSVIVTFITSWLPASLESAPANYKHYKLIFCLLCFQSFRRLLESLYITKFSSKAKINVFHYIMGLAFYTTISLNCFLSLLPYYLNTAIIPANGAFDLTDKILITLFILLSIDQFQNHYHLSTLLKYSVPNFGMFQIVGSAHYLDEIIIYLIVAIIGNLHEELSIIDINYILGWAFVAVNLSISSLESYAYYKAKFPEFTVKYSIIPGIL
ncbi:unnamed protein product [Debaryomyces tyrocola]|nr:unnamed protein product [Debaryomyces tyrocola]